MLECEITQTVHTIQTPRDCWFAANDVDVESAYREAISDATGVLQDLGPWEGMRFAVDADHFTQVAERKLLAICRRFKRRQDRLNAGIRKQPQYKVREEKLLPAWLRKGVLARRTAGPFGPILEPHSDQPGPHTSAARRPAQSRSRHRMRKQ